MGKYLPSNMQILFLSISKLNLVWSTYIRYEYINTKLQTQYSSLSLLDNEKLF